MVELYNFLTSEEGHVIILNDWKKGGVTGVVENTEVLPLKTVLDDDCCMIMCCREFCCKMKHFCFH